MSAGGLFRRYWPETLLIALVTLPWLSLLALGLVWLWQGGRVAIWALAAAALGLLAWPVSRVVRRRADEEARHALGDVAEPESTWNTIERDAWNEVLVIADSTPPLTFTEIETLVARGRDTVLAVSRRFHPDATSAWSHFSLPEALLLAERLARDFRREALHHIPGIRAVRLNHLLWLQQQNEQYGAVAKSGWRVGYGIWRLVRATLNPLQALGQETSGMMAERTLGVLSYRLRGYATRLLILETGRAAIDLYSGRLTLSDDEMRAAQQSDLAAAAAPPLAPVRILLIGQVSAGKSSLLNALAQEVRAAMGPLPTTTNVSEHQLELDGRPAVILVDMPGLNDEVATPEELLRQTERADLVIWVASAMQSAREADRKALDAFRGWNKAQLARRPAPLLLALTHIDQLRPSAEWSPPYDIVSAARTKARSIHAAIDAISDTLILAPEVVVPIAMPPDRSAYNIDALWARIAVEIDEAKLVQLDRLRVGHQRLSLGELANQIARAGRLLIKGAANT
jgi:predicted GTPase